MSELLTSLDIVNQAFRKTIRGYDPAEVDEFLDRVAECIQIYVQKIKDCEYAIEEQSEKLREYESIKDSLHETLLTAQRTAEEKLNNADILADEKIEHARATAENILTGARAEAESLVRDAETSVLGFGRELTTLRELRDAGLAGLRSYIGEIGEFLDKAERADKIQIPAMTLDLMTRSETRTDASARQAFEYRPPRFAENRAAASAPKLCAAPVQNVIPEHMQERLANTLNVLGIDLGLLDTNPSRGSDKA
ncbi:MAG: DivIVA domain-containing protein [Synergistaceae bacterium]|jgi:cell division initiation protein|nr:DivIVA domain-containing protein [Synergistaceae bacterium]